MSSDVPAGLSVTTGASEDTPEVEPATVEDVIDPPDLALSVDGEDHEAPDGVESSAEVSHSSDDVELSLEPSDGGVGNSGASDPTADLRSELEERRALLAEAEEKVKQARRHSTQAEMRAERLRSMVEDAASSSQRLLEAESALQDWVAGRQNSFAWRLLETLEGEETKAQSALTSEVGTLRQEIQAPALTPSVLQDEFMKKAYRGLTVGLFVFGLAALLQQIVPDEAKEFGAPVNPLSWPLWVFAIIAVVIALVMVTRGLTEYFRKNAEMQWALTNASHTLRQQADAAHALRREVQRLKTLHAQVPEYLRYLSEVLHRPWDVPTTALKSDESDESTSHNPASALAETSDVQDTPEALVFGSRRPDERNLPSLMRIADPVPGAGGSQEQDLVRLAIQEVLRPQWRFDALVLLIEAVELRSQVRPGTFAVERLDRDPKLRIAFFKCLEDNEARVDAGRSRLRDLSGRIQTRVLDEIHPPVREIGVDPVMEIGLDTDLLATQDRGIKEWDDFLAEALSEATAWSSLNFSSVGHAEARESKDDIKTYAYGPERLADAISDDVEFVGTPDKSVRPVDLVIRVDTTVAALAPKHYKVFEGIVTNGSTDEARDSNAPEPHVSHNRL